MSRTPPAWNGLLAAATIFLSAFLLFQVQPLISKAILPWFGGSPAVWSACLLFFQVALLAGYAYAHALIRWQWRHKYWLHAALLIVALLSLPITPREAWKPVDGTQPTWRILLLLTAHVGLPYFLLSSTGPLVQAWFGQLFPQRTPYRLYALSNLGSLGALVSYPILVEPRWSTLAQGWNWSLGFVMFALMASLLTRLVMRFEEHAATPTLTPTPTPAPAPALSHRMSWLALAALASTALLAVTNHLCQDIAVAPFFWVAPLSLYLLSFIICFDRDFWYRPVIMSLVLLGTTLTILACAEGDVADRSLQSAMKWLTGREDNTRYVTWFVMQGVRWLDPSYTTFRDSVRVYSALHLLWFFALAMICHGEIARLKPPREELTRYYLMISVGGALGGMFVSLVCPLLFKTYYEMPLSIILGAAVALLAIVLRLPRRAETDLRSLRWALGLFAMGFVVLIAHGVTDREEKALVQVRNFYGVLSVKAEADGTENAGRGLYHGRIMHGYQYTEPDRQREPSSYYALGSGVQLAVDCYPRQADRPFRMAVVGLGSGTMAAFGRDGDVIRFYEIDAKVDWLSQTYFTFRQDSAAKVEVVLGDARVQMEREAPQQYDVIVLDAFSGDAIPIHLLTHEAVEVYRRHLRPEGILAVHISNRYLNLLPVTRGIAEKFGYGAALIKLEELSGGPAGSAGSDWVLLTHNQDLLTDPAVLAVNKWGESRAKPVYWTDQRSDLLGVMTGWSKLEEEAASDE